MYPSPTFSAVFQLKCRLACNGYAYWSNSTRLVVTGVEEENRQLPGCVCVAPELPESIQPEHDTYDDVARGFAGQAGAQARYAVSRVRPPRSRGGSAGG